MKVFHAEHGRDVKTTTRVVGSPRIGEASGISTGTQAASVTAPFAETARKANPDESVPRPSAATDQSSHSGLPLPKGG